MRVYIYISLYFFLFLFFMLLSRYPESRKPNDKAPVASQNGPIPWPLRQEWCTLTEASAPDTTHRDIEFPCCITQRPVPAQFT